MVGSMCEEPNDDLHRLVVSALVRVVQNLSERLQVVNPVGQVKNDFLYLPSSIPQRRLGSQCLINDYPAECARANSAVVQSR